MFNWTSGEITLTLPAPALFAGDVWILGDSLIRRAATRLGTKPEVRWNSLGGAKYGDVTNLMAGLAARWPCPATFIVQLGTNELIHTDLFFFRQRLAVFM